MGCPGSVILGKNLVFSICCHDPDTGVLTDADAPPTYRIYEDETATAIANDVMAVLDTGNTTGFYTELIACTALAGYEADKSYTIYIEATVDGDTGGISYGFTVEAAVPTAIEVADAILKRDFSSVTGEAARSALNSLRFLRNKWTLVGTTLSVKKEDDTEEAWNAEVTTNAAADPITGSDPT